MVNVARKREWKLASDILLTESFLSESFLTVFSQVEIPLNTRWMGTKSITYVIKAVNVKILHEILVHKLSLYLYTLYT